MPTKTPVKIIKIWMQGYRPFVMGGSPDYAICTEVECQGPFDMPKGIKVYTTIGPDGKFYVIESTTGGIVGNSLGQVKRDIDSATPKMLRQQLQAAAAMKEWGSEDVTPIEFWAFMEKANQRAGK